jgi:hypothetical protein
MAAFSNLSELREEVRRRLGALESTKLAPSEAEEEDSIRDVLSEFNRIRPQRFTSEIAGDGSQRRFVLATELAGPPTWVDNASELLSLELVTGANTDDERVLELDDAEWEIRQTTAGDLVLFVATAPGASETLRFTWSLPQTLDDLDGASATTIHEQDKPVFVLLVAAECAELIARKASDLADHTLGVDQVDFQSYQRRWRVNADRLHKRAEQRLVPSVLSAGGSGIGTEWETRNTFGRPRISH